MFLRLVAFIMLAAFGFCIAQEGDSAKAKPEKEVNAAKVAKDYGITEDSVNAIKTKYSLGYGEVSKALSLSQKSGTSVEDILRMKTEQKMGWGQIAKKLNLKPGKDYKADNASGKKQQHMEDKEVKKQEKSEVKAEKKAEKAEQKANKDK
jgi:hypothetical protein